MMRLAFRIGYWGDGFYGSQVQSEVRTVEGDVVAACRKLGLFDDPREARFAFAGRTDRGVHAAGQVCAFTTDVPERAVAALPYRLPADIWITGWAEVPDRFSPRKEATSRTYRYFFEEHPGDAVLMNEVAQFFLGEHDFSLLSRRSERSPVRRVHAARVYEEGGFCVFEVTAAGFLWNMVRCMASALAAVGRGEKNPEWIRTLLRGEEERRVAAAPPGGLILTDIAYDFEFTALAPSPKAEGALFRREKDFRVKVRVNEALKSFFSH
ncbi:MAG: tRNA pseudouridine(38-40) synthase TruA [Methanofollis sp.]|nr:tRNA pseudouridine(38-40) synthase TruA [Methanofollis sp.]